MIDHSNYHTGRVEMVNFMTYRNVVFNAGPKLNIILGQNGSGKSTIACAVCIALGEDPKLLLRGTKLEEFIKYGEKEARVVLLIRGEESDISVESRIHRSGASFFVNGHACNKERLREFRRSLKIDLNNLCQFLPQDRVADFVNQNAQKRLREFEKSVGGEDFSNMHTELINSQQQETFLNTSIVQKEQTIQIEKLQNQNLLREKEKFEARNKLLRQKHNLELYIKTLTYSDKSKSLGEIRTQIADVKKELQTINEQDAGTQNTIKQYEQSIKHINTIVEREKEKITQSTTAIETINLNNKNCHRNYDRTEKQLLAIDISFKKTKQELKELQQKLEVLDGEISSLQDMDIIKANIRKYEEEKTKLTEEKRNAAIPLNQARERLIDLRKQQSSIELENHNITNLDQQRLNQLNKMDKNTVHALKWIQKNQSLFHSRVYGPIINEISFGSKLHAQWFENCVSRNLMLTFIAQCPEDYDRLQMAIQKKEIHCNVAMMDVLNANTQPKIHISPESRSDLQVLGLVIDLVKCEDIIRRALLNFSSLSAVAYANENWNLSRDSDYIQRVCNQEGSFIVMTPNVQHRIMLSKWRNSITRKKEVSVQIIALRPIKFLDIASKVDMETLKRNQDQLVVLQQQIADINHDIEQYTAVDRQYIGKLQYIQQDLNQWDQKRKDHVNKTNRRHLLCHDIEMKQNEVDKGVDDQKESQLQKLKDITMQLSQAAHTKQKELHKLLQLTICYEAMIQVSQVQQQHYDDLKSEYEQRANHIKALEETKKILDIKRAALREELKKLRSYIYTESGLFHCKNNPDPNDFSCKCSNGRCVPEPTALSRKIKEEYSSLDINQCNAELDVMQHKINEIHINERCIAEYDKREKSIAKLEKEYEDLKKQLEDIKTNLGTKQQNFMNTLKRLTNKLDANFSVFMANIQCKGKVELINADNFNQIGLDIKVSFRDNQELQSLNGQVQSGGEKSLSTILFLLSLQTMVSFPFRFIDEINQNMDKRNERYVMTQLLYKGKVKNSLAPQTFIITPKLLSDFPYDDTVTFHIIFQGQYLPQNFNWNVFAASLTNRSSEKRNTTQPTEKTKRQKTDETVDNE